MGIGVIGAIALTLGITQNIDSFVPSLGRLLKQNTNTAFPNEIPDIATLLEMKRRNQINDELFDTALKAHGISDEWKERLETIALRYPSIDEYVRLYRRGILTYDELKERSLREGFDVEALYTLLKASEVYPPVNDLIRFAVREVYSPDIRKKFGMDQGFPKDFEIAASHLGLNYNFAKDYWASHWQLPSTLQAFEMLHRRVINNQELQMLLKAQDVMPFWRDKLTAISYNPLTRVDVRRMHAIGELSLDEVYESYLDIGYSPKNAQRMASFTEKYNSNEIDSITITQVKSAFMDGIITFEEMNKWLEEIGLSETEIIFHRNQVLYDKTVKDINTKKNALIDRYRKGDLSLDQVRNELFKEGLPSTYVSNVIDELIVNKGERLKVPSKEDATEWLSLNVIDDIEFTDILRRLGYSDINIHRYLTQFSIENDTTRKKYLKLDIYIRWYKKGIMNYDDFNQVLHEMEYSEEDINNIIAESKGDDNET